MIALSKTTSRVNKKGKQPRHNKEQIEYQQLCMRIKNLTEAYILYRQPIQFYLLENCCKRRDYLEQQLYYK